MRYKFQIRAFGCIPQAVKQGRKGKEKNPAVVEGMNKQKEICLNCTKKKCTGGCKKVAHNKGETRWRM